MALPSTFMFSFCLGVFTSSPGYTVCLLHSWLTFNYYFQIILEEKVCLLSLDQMGVIGGYHPQRNGLAGTYIGSGGCYHLFTWQ